MRYIKILCVVLSIALMLCLTSCTSTSYQNKNISFRTTANITTLDPQLAKTDAEITAVINCFEGLMAVGIDGEITNGAINSYTVSDNGLEYVFNLKTTLVWEDEKTKVTAHDFVFGFQRALSKNTKSPFAQLLFSIKNAKSVYNNTLPSSKLGVVATNDYTLSLTLEKQDHNLLSTLAHPVAMPCNKAFFESTNGRYGLDNENTLCNGAFYLKRWNTEENYLSLARFDSYNGNNPAIPASVTLGFNRDLDNIENGLTNEEIDIGFLSGDYASDLKTEQNLKAFYNTSYVLFIAKDAFSKNLRKALFTDINQDTITLNLPSFIDGTPSIIPTSSKEGSYIYRTYAGELKLPEYNSKNAKKLISQLKEDYETDFSDIKLYYPSKDIHLTRAASQLVQTWQKDLNILVNTVEEDASEINLKFENKEIDMAILPLTSVTGNAKDATNMIKTLGYSRVNKIIEKSSTSINDLCENIKLMEQTLIDDYYAYPLYCEPTFCCMSKSLNDVAFNSTGSFCVFRYIKEED